MAKRVQLLRFDTSAMALTKGKAGEVMVNTSKNTLVVHNDVTLGGFEIALADASNIQNATASQNGRMTLTQVGDLTTAMADIITNTAAIVANDVEILALQDDKADKIIPATVNNIAVLDSAGNLVDGGATIDQIIEAGTRMFFPQAAAPTGWTQDDTFNDRMIRLVDSTVSGAYAVDWETDGDGGSWTISGVTVDGHSITVAEMPSHSHDALGSTGSSTGSGTSGGGQFLGTTDGGFDTGARGGDDPHVHGLTSDAAWRPAYADTIACIRD